MGLRHLIAAALAWALAACAVIPEPARNAAEPLARAPAWAFQSSDLAPDPAWRFGTLPNGMRYMIRRNGTPPGQAMVQLHIGSGSLAEGPQDRGLAHFIEHMAFNGSTNVTEGEMVRLLERKGLAFGADTNASTGFDATIYKLDLPRAEEGLLDTALFLMRETASELAFDPEAVEREKGVLLSERRTRDTWQLRNIEDRLSFLYPQSLFAQRLPIGTAATIAAASPEQLRGLWQRLYRPSNAVLVVVGDFDPDMVEEQVQERFVSWQATGPVAPAEPGPFDFARKGRTHVYLDPALSERVTISRTGPWNDEPDSVASRRTGVLRQIGYGIVNRRLTRLARGENPVLADAGFGTGDVFRHARTTNLIVDVTVGGWQRGLAAAQAEYRRALQFGFSDAEVAEQMANMRTGLENAAAGAGTFSNPYHVNRGLALVEDGEVPTTPASDLARFEAIVPGITPAAVLAALREDAIPLDDPDIRFEGRAPPKGGKQALRAAWAAGMQAEIAAPEAIEVTQFAYTDFGPAGTVVEDRTDPDLGIRMIRFDNGVMLNLKRTDLQDDRVLVEVNVDGGLMLNTRDAPLATAMVRVLPQGGLGRHPLDELQSVLAGRSVSLSIGTQDTRFVLAATTTPRDLELQLQLMAAGLTDPGYRRDGEILYRRQIRDYFAGRDATPGSALSGHLGGILSDNDPRFTQQAEEDYLALDFAGLRQVVAEPFGTGAIEIAVVGDFEESAVIDYIARTFGALPAREPRFRDWEDRRQRSFTADRSPRVIAHDGPGDQAIVRMTWPVTDDSDEELALTFDLLAQVLRLSLTDVLREELGETYSPAANASLSRTYRGYGIFAIAAAVDANEVGPVSEAMTDAVAALIAAPVDDDVLVRARAPMLELYRNFLSTNQGWMALVDRAQSEPERIARFQRAEAFLLRVTPADIQALAARYLRPEDRLDILVLPRGMVDSATATLK